MARIAIVGATGAVGREILNCLEQRARLKVDDLRPLASARSAGTCVRFAGKDIKVEALTPAAFDDVDIAFFAASGDVSRDYVGAARAAGAVVIDNSSAFRLDPAVPLVVPEVNPQALAGHAGLIANPNCSTIIALLPVAEIDRSNRVLRLQVSTYQAASGAGTQGMLELEEGTRAALAGERHEPKVFKEPYAFNLFSHNSRMSVDSGYNEEELKLVNESRKILGRPDLLVSATCIRVPVMRAHAESITLQCAEPVDLDALRRQLERARGIRVVDDRRNNRFPTPLQASGQGDVLVGRLRIDMSDPSGCSVSFMAVGDQLLKGAALNAVQIAEMLAA